MSAESKAGNRPVSQAEGYQAEAAISLRGQSPFHSILAPNGWSEARTEYTLLYGLDNINTQKDVWLNIRATRGPGKPHTKRAITCGKQATEVGSH